ncbi:zinc finger protein 407 [Phlebotomus argentipes]|uniref:zinc finger protein 407 n=1 Tax=Phlebotomus argentipes TaxID=94469 RepID=UPI0028935C3A|nr:zinc finger protein 407 [Phlebotomus argentipes]
MKKVIQPNVRKVYGPSMQQQQTEIQMNAVRKINSLLSTGAVSVTGPTQPRILKQKPQIFGLNSQQSQKCYVCDEACGIGASVLLDTLTPHSHSKLPNKIGRLIGDAFLVIVRADDVVCKRCVSLFGRMDSLETELERIRSNVLTFICKKYGITEDEIRPGGVNSGPPPAKVQKIAGGTKVVTRILATADHDDGEEVRKLARTEAAEYENTEVRTMPALVRASTNSSAVRKVVSSGQPAQREPIKIYRCATCDHTTPDLKQFQAHYETCRSTWPCKVCRKIFTTSSALKQHTAEKHPSDYTCHFCNLNFLNDTAYKKHLEVSHPDVKLVESPAAATPANQTGAGRGVIYTCSICQWKTGERLAYEDHMRKHNKMKPFKCRICNMRFETRESASKHAKTHQPDYFKCGDCAASFQQREQLMKHFEVHHKAGGQKVVVSSNSTPTSQSVTTQKLLQETIDEALRDSGDGLDPKGIHFFSCNICSLTFIQENYYNQHMETHKRDTKKVSTAGTLPTVSAAATTAQRQSLIRQDVRSTNATILGTQGATISDADLESIFEKMHAEKGDGDAASAVQTTTSDNLVITKQSTASGGITYNITIPQQQDGSTAVQEAGGGKVIFHANEGEGGQISAGIDMPVLDNMDESEAAQQQQEGHQQQQEATEGGAAEAGGDAAASGAPVSMPSLDDDADSQSQSANIDAVPMELDEMQSGVEGEQIKFILNENGQLLQLDNHIITTDADGNQIIVQGADSEHLQQLLQSVAGLDGSTIQMIGDNNQMILVQQGDGEPQLLDASLLNADGHIVIQQAQDGESQSSEDVQIPTTVAYTTAGGQVNAEDGEHQAEEEQQPVDGEVVGEQTQEVVGEQPMETEEEEVAKEVTEEQEVEQQVKEDTEEQTKVADGETEGTPVTSVQTTTSSDVFFNIDDLMGHPEAEQK